jgi:hypothetical protein
MEFILDGKIKANHEKNNYLSEKIREEKSKNY